VSVTVIFRAVFAREEDIGLKVRMLPEIEMKSGRFGAVAVKV
jgi:hypothetical protein